MFLRTPFGQYPYQTFKPETSEEQNQRIKKASDALETKKAEWQKKREDRDITITSVLTLFGFSERTGSTSLLFEYDSKEHLLDSSSSLSTVAQLNNIDVDLYLLEKNLERARGPKVY